MLPIEWKSPKIDRLKGSRPSWEVWKTTVESNQSAALPYFTIIYKKSMNALQYSAFQSFVMDWILTMLDD